MATVTGFEGLRHPRRSDLRQFAELFEPLFASSSDEARRQAAAALSQCPHVPQSVALLIGSAPIAIAVIFLTRSTSITDATLLQIIRTQGPAHATAIARRENLSVHVVDALVERRQTSVAPEKAMEAPAARETPPPGIVHPDAARLLREEKLRDDIKALARLSRENRTEAAVIEPISPLHEALLVRFARSGEANLLAASLADALSASPALAERIVLDISGQRLATALTALGMQRQDSLFVLGSLYPHLAERFGGTTRGEVLIASISLETCRSRVQSWLHAEQEEAAARPEHQAYHAAERGADPRQATAHADKSARAGAIQPQQAFSRRR